MIEVTVPCSLRLQLNSDGIKASVKIDTAGHKQVLYFSDGAVVNYSLFLHSLAEQLAGAATAATQYAAKETNAESSN